MDRQITLIWRRKEWPCVYDVEEMDCVLVCHKPCATFYETLNYLVFCPSLFYSSSKPLIKCIFC